MRKIIFIMALFFSTFLASGCLGTGSEIYLNSTADELLLSELWEIAVEETGVENETAELDQLIVNTQDSGSLEYVLLEFRGTKAGKWKYFLVRVDENGKVSWRESKLNGAFLESLHPLPVLKAVETVCSGLRAGSEIGTVVENTSLPLNFSPPSQDLLVHAGFLAGGISYGGQPRYSVCLFKNGSAVPLDHIGFESKNPWCEIMIFWPEASNVTIVEEKNGLFREGIVKSTRTISRVNKNASEAGAPDHIIVFLEEDLDKASYVEYAEDDLFFE